LEVNVLVDDFVGRILRTGRKSSIWKTIGVLKTDCVTYIKQVAIRASWTTIQTDQAVQNQT